jgi:hypothetical protein
MVQGASSLGGGNLAFVRAFGIPGPVFACGIFAADLGRLPEPAAHESRLLSNGDASRRH